MVKKVSSNRNKNNNITHNTHCSTNTVVAIIITAVGFKAGARESEAHRRTGSGEEIRFRAPGPRWELERLSATTGLLLPNGSM